MKDPKDAREGEWDFDGSCAPPENGGGPIWDGMETFSLGCFQWVRRGNDGRGKGLKKGKVQYRVKGLVADPADAYGRARAYCARKNAQAAVRAGA